MTWFTSFGYILTLTHVNGSVVDLSFILLFIFWNVETQLWFLPLLHRTRCKILPAALTTTPLMWWWMGNQWIWAFGTQQDRRTTIGSDHCLTHRRYFNSSPQWHTRLSIVYEGNFHTCINLWDPYPKLSNKAVTSKTQAECSQCSYKDDLKLKLHTYRASCSASLSKSSMSHTIGLPIISTDIGNKKWYWKILVSVFTFLIILQILYIKLFSYRFISVSENNFEHLYSDAIGMKRSKNKAQDEQVEHLGLLLSVARTE